MGWRVTAEVLTAWPRPQLVAAAAVAGCRSYDGPFTGKRELAGCGGGQPGIAQLDPLQQQQLAGSWAANTAGSAAAATVSSSSSSPLSCLTDSGAAPAGVQLTLLPLSAWSAVQLSSDGELLRAEAGVLHHHQQQRAVSVRAYGDPADSRLGVEAKA